MSVLLDLPQIDHIFHGESLQHSSTVWRHQCQPRDKGPHATFEAFLRLFPWLERLVHPRISYSMMSPNYSSIVSTTTDQWHLDMAGVNMTGHKMASIIQLSGFSIRDAHSSFFPQTVQNKECRASAMVEADHMWFGDVHLSSFFFFFRAFR